MPRLTAMAAPALHLNSIAAEPLPPSFLHKWSPKTLVKLPRTFSPSPSCRSILPLIARRRLEPPSAPSIAAVIPLLPRRSFCPRRVQRSAPRPPVPSLRAGVAGVGRAGAGLAAASPLSNLHAVSGERRRSVRRGISQGWSHPSAAHPADPTTAEVDKWKRYPRNTFSCDESVLWCSVVRNTLLVH